MGMAELIDRNVLLKVLIHRVKGNEDNHIVLGTNNALALVEEWVRSIPTIDAIPVVRCKDCKHLGFKGLGDGVRNRKMVGIIKPDDFCSYGERKDNEN